MGDKVSDVGEKVKLGGIRAREGGSGPEGIWIRSR
jgi:hypothetical protein